MLPPAIIAAALRTAAPFPGGPTFDLLCQAIANAIVAWLPTGVTLTGVTAGVVGAGTVTGTLAFAGTPPLVLGAMGALRGTNVPALATTLAAGLNSGLAGLPYAGVSTGVGTGTDTSLVVSANIPALAQVLRTSHTAACAVQGGTGSTVPAFYEALAAGIATVVITGTGIGAVAPTGPLGPSSSVGTSASVPV
jgi:hypothetical protein